MVYHKQLVAYMEEEIHSMSVESVCSELNTNLEIGLSSKEVETRLETFGPNVLIAQEKDSPLKMFLMHFKDFLVYLLIGAALISLIFGDYIEAAIIIVIVVLNAVMGFIQEYRAEESLEKLKELTGDDTLVIREGNETRVDTRDIVPGDILLMYEGETIAADARIFEASRLRVEEGILTGESVPVDKSTKPIMGEYVSLGDQTNIAFMGTTTVKGRGRAIVTRTSMSTEMGKIAKSTLETEEQDTPLQIQLDRLGKMLGIIVVIVCALVLVFQILKENGNITEALETSIALAVSAVPEGLAAAITLTLAIGVQRMARKQAIIRKFLDRY